ncbi:hypothetical protein EVAR_60569_1 [Eumeta japonica]|uniref:Uncharacterized protein n=1 Tax=Eumeta variegata TaxID=151549 RepID=A0A4C1YIF3_EUMVA|nr:hypothetical protein EVAR_60569_1 [Eumeta japonica]
MCRYRASSPHPTKPLTRNGPASEVRALQYEIKRVWEGVRLNGGMIDTVFVSLRLDYTICLLLKHNLPLQAEDSDLRSPRWLSAGRRLLTTTVTTKLSTAELQQLHCQWWLTIDELCDRYTSTPIPIKHCTPASSERTLLLSGGSYRSSCGGALF